MDNQFIEIEMNVKPLKFRAFRLKATNLKLITY
jgi:hypothetical protein